MPEGFASTVNKLRMCGRTGQRVTKEREGASPPIMDTHKWSDNPSALPMREKIVSVAIVNTSHGTTPTQIKNCGNCNYP